MAASEAQKRATAKWQKDNTKSVSIRFGKSNMDAYDVLMAQPNKTAFIVGLIREYQRVGSRESRVGSRKSDDT